MNNYPRFTRRGPSVRAVNDNQIVPANDNGPGSPAPANVARASELAA
jgi:hypothetical protein